MARLGATLLVTGFLGAAGFAAAKTSVAADPEPATVTVTTTTAVTATVAGVYQGRTARAWQHRFRHRTRQLQAARAQLRRRWRPTVTYAMRLAAAVTGVPYSALAAVAWCESRYDPYATNGRYRGIFQLGWTPFGFSPYDPVANALSAALTVARDGSWRQWSCKP